MEEAREGAPWELERRRREAPRTLEEDASDNESVDSILGRCATWALDGGIDPASDPRLLRRLRKQQDREPPAKLGKAPVDLKAVDLAAIFGPDVGPDARVEEERPSSDVCGALSHSFSLPDEISRAICTYVRGAAWSLRLVNRAFHRLVDPWKLPDVVWRAFGPLAGDQHFPGLPPRLPGTSMAPPRPRNGTGPARGLDKTAKPIGGWRMA